MDEDHGGGSLSDDELRDFMILLRRYCEHDLDQWELWRLNTSYGPVYINIGRRPFDGCSAEAYDEIRITE